MHIPDGFLSTPVWAALDVAAAPSVAYVAHRAQRGFEDARIPLLGVMGAFVFAAQMINFPIGVGTSSHLVGGALLAITLGPAAAAVVMTAILAIQALVFQDGGILALGANVVNMAICGVLAGYLPYYLLGARWKRAAVFAGGTLSVLVSALLALSELIASKVPMPAAALGVSLIVFTISAALEGAITLAVVQALETIQPDFVRRPARARGAAVGLLGAAAVLMAGVCVVFASTDPDGIQKLTRFEMEISAPGWVSQAGAGLGGLALIYLACLLFARFAARRRRA